MPDRITVVGLGEVLWDVFPDGARFGGAPANFACSTAELAGDTLRVAVVSAVGRDELGRRAISELEGHGVETGCVAECGRPTGQVLVKLDASGHASYTFASDTAWDNLEWSESFEELARQADAVCFGTLGQRSRASRETIRRFVRSTRGTCLRVFDINLRPPFWTEEVVVESLKLANVLKLNDSELPVLSEIVGLRGSDRERLEQLVQRYSLHAAALTRGAHGSLLVDRSGESSDLPGQETAVTDTVGAGDAFTAALVLGLLSQQPLSEINARANRVAAFVCSQAGATPRFPEVLRQPMPE